MSGGSGLVGVHYLLGVVGLAAGYLGRAGDCTLAQVHGGSAALLQSSHGDDQCRYHALQRPP